jgi:hypothetical protein
VIAWHEDYIADTITVTVQPEGITEAPDLVLRPDGYMRGTLRLDMNNDGSYEQQYTIDLDLVIAGWNQNPGTCPGSAAPHPLIFIGGFSLGPDQDFLSIQVNPPVVTETGYYDLGGLDLIHCSSTTPGAVTLITQREKCTYPEGYQGPMAFDYMSDPKFLPCNCGITDPGNLILEAYDTTMTGVLRGSTIATLAGSITCSCQPDSVSGCARAYLDVEFKALMGSLSQQSGLLKAWR